MGNPNEITAQEYRPSSLMLAVVLGTLVALALSEAVLALAGIPRVKGTVDHAFTEPPEIVMVDEPAGMTLYRLKPLSRMHFIYPEFGGASRNEIIVQANADGFRGPDCRPRSSSPETRILFLGDSFTFGAGVELEDSFPEQVIRILRETGKDVVGCNRAMFGYNTMQDWFVFNRDSGSLDPDIVVLGYFLNDASGPLFTVDPNTGLVSQDSANPFWAASKATPTSGIFRSRLARLVWEGHHFFRVQRITKEYYRSLYLDSNPWRDPNRESLSALVNACEEKNIRLLILIFPVLEWLDTTYPFEAIHRFVTEDVMSQAISCTQVIDLLPKMRNRPPKSLWVHPMDHHPNKMVHEEVARIVVEALNDPRATFASCTCPPDTLASHHGEGDDF